MMKEDISRERSNALNTFFDMTGEFEKFIGMTDNLLKRMTALEMKKPLMIYPK